MNEAAISIQKLDCSAGEKHLPDIGLILCSIQIEHATTGLG